MGKPKMLGMNKPYVPNSKADRRKNQVHQKERKVKWVLISDMSLTRRRSDG